MTIPVEVVILMSIELLCLAKRVMDTAGQEVSKEQIAAVFAKANKAEKEWEDAGTAEPTEEP